VRLASIRVPLLLALLGVGAYANAISNGFVLDDGPAVLTNRCVRDQASAACAFSSDLWGRPGREVGRTYRPLVVLSFALDWRWGGGRPWALHLSNVLLHGAATVAIFLLLLQLNTRRRRAPGDEGEGDEGGERRLLAPVAGAALFATLAVHGDAVAAVVGRADVLATLLVAAALTLHLRPAASTGARWVSTVTEAVLFLGALLCHELALLGLVLAVAADVARGDLALARWPWWRYAALAVAVVEYFALRWTAMGRLVGPVPEVLNNPAVATAGLGRILLGLSLAGRAMSLMLVPLGLSAEYGLGAIRTSGLHAEPLLYVGAVSLALLAIGAWSLRHRSPLAAAGCGLLLGGLVLLSNVPVLLPTAFAERLLYLPSVGLVMILGAAVEAGAARGRATLAIVVCSLVVAANLAVGLQRNRDWRDEISLFGSAVVAQPQSARAQLNLGLALNHAGRHAEAIIPLRRALEIADDLVVAERELAMAYDLLGRPDEARLHFASAYARAPNDRLTVFNFAHFLRRHAELDQARELLDRHLQIDPGDRPARHLRASLASPWRR
jgi:protein O-mannosyl-transferase